MNLVCLCVCVSIHIFQSHQKSQGHEILGHVRSLRSPIFKILIFKGGPQSPHADLPTTAGIPVDLPVFAKSTGTTGGSNFSTVFCCQQCFLLFFRGLRKNLRERPVINYNCM